MTQMAMRGVTRIRGEFTASGKLHEAVRNFYDADHQPPYVRLYTAMQRIVPLWAYHEHMFDPHIAKAEAGLKRPLARRALRLAAQPSPTVGSSHEGGVSIVFHAQPIDVMHEISKALQEIPNWEVRHINQGVLLELGRAGLHEDPAKLNRARQALLETLHNPAPTNALTVGNVRLSAKDIQNYPLLSSGKWLHKSHGQFDTRH